MDRSKSIDKVKEVEEILDSLLTEAMLGRLVLKTSILYDSKGEAARRRLFAEVLDHTGQTLASELGRELSPQEVMLVFEWVKKFLNALGLH